MKTYKQQIRKQTFRTKLLFSLVIFLGLTSMAAAQEFAGEPSGIEARFNVGYTVLDFNYIDGDSEKTITVAVWYPTDEVPHEFNYGGPTIGNIAIKADLDTNSGPYPLLVFSHGGGGTGIGSVFFTESLAAQGWIVAAPDHHDKYSFVRIRTGQNPDFARSDFLKWVNQIVSSGPEEREPYLYRLDELQAVLDGMTGSEQFAKFIDKDKIAVGGHSFGGYTALGLCGTIPERYDDRIKAVLLFSTGAGGYLFSEEELSRVNMPLMIYLGKRERHQMRASVAMEEIVDKIYRSAASSKYFLEIEGANHFSFNNRFDHRFITRYFSGTEEQFDVIRSYSIAFLEKHVAGNESADTVLFKKHPMLSRFIYEP